MASRRKTGNAVKRADFLSLLARSKPSRRKYLVSSADASEILAIAECVLNLHKRNIRVSAEKKKKLLHFRKELGGVCSKSTSVKRKKQLILKRGGFLNVLASALLPTAIGFITKTLGLGGN